MVTATSEMNSIELSDNIIDTYTTQTTQEYPGALSFTHVHIFDMTCVHFEYVFIHSNKYNSAQR